jgi:opacity protein-like surface antigen
MQVSKIVVAVAVSVSGIFVVGGNSAGFYAGISGGGDYLKFKLDSKDSKDSIASRAAKAVYGDGTGALGPNIGLVLGCGCLTSQKVYIGAQLNAYVSFATPKIHEPVVVGGCDCVGELQHQSKYNFGGNVLLGYHFVPRFMIYLLAGAEAKRATVKSIVTIKGQNQGVPFMKIIYLWDEAKTVEGVDFSKSELKANTFVCGVVGLGSRYFMTKCLFVGFEIKASFGHKSSIAVGEHYEADQAGNAAPVVRHFNAENVSDNVGSALKMRNLSFGAVIGCKL